MTPRSDAPDAPPVTRERYLTVQQWDRVRAAAAASSLRDEALIRVIYEAGLRRDEAGALRLSYATKLAATRELYVWRGKDSRSNYVELSETTGEVLHRWIAELKRTQRALVAALGVSTPIFPGGRYGNRREGLAGRSVYEIFQRLAEAAQLPQELRHPHVLKHSRVQHMLDYAVANGVEPFSMAEAIAKIVGHKSVQTTLRHYVSRFGKAPQIARAITERLSR